MIYNVKLFVESEKNRNEKIRSEFILLADKTLGV